MAEMNVAAGNAGRKNRKRMPPPRVDLTAMVDLAFLLITFFMMTTTFNKPKIMPVAMPVDGPGGEVSEKRTMTVCLGDDNKALWYLGLAEKPILPPKVAGYGADGIRKGITEAADYVKRTTGKTLIVIIKPANSSVYEDLVNTIDEMDINKVPSYAVADISPVDEGLLKQNGIY
ncbi:biopolymer transporter ExbD [Mucilaginibacter hurinus]|uniref:Biopolymer transporter ExbD n=1 Tax=Mucilaginibacter hurinus TaxID=2201324 RepID=A0A367GUM0_9SPHI|nr:biopolymer transporter ExbD [Mucilaginibacter hurinus]RCH56526.1 biopolymer transporter ExbD [Mucilaginibacter hurinus]